MKLKVTTAFNDMTIADPDTRRREIGAEFEADDTRGAQLAWLGFVEVDAVQMPASVAEPVPPPATVEPEPHDEPVAQPPA